MSKKNWLVCIWYRHATYSDPCFQDTNQLIWCWISIDIKICKRWYQARSVSVSMLHYWRSQYLSLVCAIGSAIFVFIPHIYELHNVLDFVVFNIHPKGFMLHLYRRIANCHCMEKTTMGKTYMTYRACILRTGLTSLVADAISSAKPGTRGSRRDFNIPQI